MSSARPSRRWWLALLILLAFAAALLLWRVLAPTSVELAVINLGDEVVELELYGTGVEQSVASGPLTPRQQVTLPLLLRGSGELRLRAASSRASIDAQLLPQATQLRDMPLQLEVRGGNRFVLMPGH